MRILVVEDEKSIANNLKKSLEAELFAVDVAHDGKKGSSLAKVNDYDLIILDHLLPHKTGFEVCTDIRNSGKHTPILMLSTESGHELKINTLNAGADDYMTKPFSTEELVARIRALLRRPPISIDEVLRVADLTCDPRAYTVTRDSKEIYLTRKEFSLLEYMMRNKGIALSRSMIMEHVWNEHANAFSNTIESHILNLRKKVDKDHRTKLIHTLPGRGYILDLR